ncbi:hypothetical protein ACWGN5_37195 [Streptomyces sp. NPDC055815]
MTLVPEARTSASDAAVPCAPAPATAEQTPTAVPVPPPAEPTDTAVPVPPPAEPTDIAVPVPPPAEPTDIAVPEQAAVPEPQAATAREADVEPLPEPDGEPLEAPGAVQGDPADLPLPRAVPGEQDTGARTDDDGEPRPEADAPTTGRPRFGTVSVPEPSRTPPARRQDLPSVRAVRLTDTPPAPADRRGPAAVTPVPLPVPRAVPTESRTEEPQP